MIALHLATMLEAHPFIHGWDLHRVGERPFAVYQNRERLLIISGIGKANAAMATGYLAWKLGADTIINAGAAGALVDTFALGEIFSINRVTEPDRPPLMKKDRQRTITIDPLPGFTTATLATQDRPAISIDERAAIRDHADLVDMEGAAVVQAARLCGIRCFLLKMVTDTPADSTDTDIIRNIMRLRGVLFERIDAGWDVLER